MKAVVIDQTGGTENLSIREVPTPAIAADQVLVKVKAIGINPVDYKVRSSEATLNGIYGDQRPAIIGWDIAGVVETVGEQVSKFKRGDQVFGMVNFPGAGNAYADFVASPASHLALKPKNISHEEAAAATLPALTAYQALVENAHVQAGQNVLVQAASGGVGHYAVQIAKHLGAHVTGISSGKNQEFVLSLGADEHIDYKKVDFQEVVKDQDFVLETLGGDSIDKSFTVIKKGGSLISIPAPLSEEQLALAKTKGIEAKFILVRSDGTHMEQLAKWLEDGIIKSHIQSVYSLDQMAEAHKALESGRTVGKIVVKID